MYEYNETWSYSSSYSLLQLSPISPNLDPFQLQVLSFINLPIFIFDNLLCAVRPYHMCMCVELSTGPCEIY